ncbi:MAG: hypothetical protein ACX94A_01760 [Algiphilus sp.]
MPQDTEETVHPHDFAAELARQVYSDLTGVLTGGDDKDAFSVTAQGGAEGRSRALWLLLRATLAAHRALRFGLGSEFAEPHSEDVLNALSMLVPELAASADHATWHEQGERLAASISASEGDREALHQALARAIYRLYDGLRREDDVQGGRGLVELRTMLAHVDAAAQLGAAGPLSTVVRPDRFHDDFLRYVEVAQNHAADAQQAVATLQRDGRITAIVTQDVHPVEQARETLAEDQYAERLRIEALLDFLSALRRSASDDPLLRACSENETAFTALVTAAATTPLRGQVGFEYAALAQVTRYNLRLLQSAAAQQGPAH